MTNTSSNEQSINDNNENLANSIMTDRVSPTTSDTESSNDGSTRNIQEQDDPLNNFRSPPNESQVCIALFSNAPSGAEGIEIAGQGLVHQLRREYTQKKGYFLNKF